MFRNRKESLESRLPLKIGDVSLSMETLPLEFPSNNEAKLKKACQKHNCLDLVKDLREQFHKATEVVVVTGTYGLGDCIMELRYALHLARKTKKRFLCQVHPALLSVVRDWQSELPNVRFTAKVPADHLNRNDVFFLSPGIVSQDLGGSYSHWLDIVPSPMTGANTNNRMDQLKQERRAMDAFLFIRERTSLQSLTEELLPHNRNRSQYDAEFATQSLILGIPIEKKDIVERSIVPLKLEEIKRVPQDLDYLIIPDAGEQPTPDKKRSKKSLPPIAWKKIFESLDKTGKIAIVKGVAHPEYSNLIIGAARASGLKVEVIEGTLSEIAVQMLRAKTIVGMDSGTTHLAVDVVRSAAKAGRTIKLKEIFKGGGGFFYHYGITDTPVLVADIPGVSDLASLDPLQIDACAQYIKS